MSLDFKVKGQAGDVAIHEIDVDHAALVRGTVTDSLGGKGARVVMFKMGDKWLLQRINDLPFIFDLSAVPSHGRGRLTFVFEFHADCEINGVLHTRAV